MHSSKVTSVGLMVIVMAVMLHVGSTAVYGSSSKATSGKTSEQSISSPFEWQAHLLRAAYEGASTFPLVPHIKNRSRAQETVVNGCVEVGLTELAEEMADGIANFRRGTSYTTIALHYIDLGKHDQAERILKKAQLVANTDDGSAWRSARVRSAMARCFARMGQHDRAVELMKDNAISLSGDGKALADVLLSVNRTLDEQLAVLETQAATGEFEQIKAALWGYGGLYKKHYSDVAKRTLIHERLEAAAKKLPGGILMEVVMDMTEYVVQKGDEAVALKLIDWANELLGNASASLYRSIPLRAQLASLTTRAGQKAEGEKILAKAMADFESGAEQLKTLQRAGTLRSIAEAHAEAGNVKIALEIYRRVFELGTINPNIRPRIVDFTDSCVSMALHGVKPDASLLARITQIGKELGPAQ